VTLTGDVSGAYLVVEERSDGSLVLAPDVSKRSGAAPSMPPSPIATLLSGLVTPREKPTSGVEVLQGWGVELGDDERIEEFFVAEVDDGVGFLAVTSQRFIFSESGKRPTFEYLLSAIRSVELVRQGLRSKLCISWDGAESLVGGLDRKAIARLQQHLQDRGLR
jgi:hypothetical protein